MPSSELLPEPMVVVCGPSGVGKSALVQRYLFGVFPPEFDPLHGAGDRKRVEVDGEPCLLEIHRSNRMESVATTEMFIRKADMFLLVYRIGSRESFDEMKERHQLILGRRPDKVPIILVGNKCDLSSNMRAVSPEEGADLARELGCGFVETSAKDNVNVEQTFTDLIRAHRRIEQAKKLVAMEEPPAKDIQHKEGGSFKDRILAFFKRLTQKKSS
ncbi:unnamed protein product [Clonostachys chloroleuca]|uniref:Uncharacterized protein n=1 Tax=Clonostachys chloroleuca TaxID=1926264 RepID=A0AA35MHT4_9HYPO|nr:unnamed protein product [Clonostachys chloroleuca]